MQAPRRFPSVRKVGLLSALYFAQGLPFGFQASALSLYLTSVGVSLDKVGLSRALALPWLLKVLWAPLVDRVGSTRFGRRKSWIVPMQSLLALTCVFAAFVPPQTHLTWLLAAVLVMNLFAATQDIAVDAFAIDLLSPEELGAGNAAQVVGYKIGMLTGGGLLVAWSATIGWKGLFFAMAGLCLGAMALVLPVKETGGASPPSPAPSGGVSWAEFPSRVKLVLAQPGASWLLVAVGTYKIGEALADAMFGPCLVREFHFETETVALWLGSFGMVGSILGSLTGGLLASRGSLVRAVGVAAVLRSLPLFLQWAIAARLIEANATSVIGVTVAEHFFGGILTTAMFALMMSKVDRRIGATHYAVLASVEVLGKAPSGLLSGFLVQGFGFATVFLGAALVSIAFIALLGPLSRRGGSSAAPAE